MFFKIDFINLLETVFNNQKIILENTRLDACKSILLPDIKQQYFLTQIKLEQIFKKFKGYFQDTYDINLQTDFLNFYSIIEIINELTGKLIDFYDDEAILPSYLEYSTLMFILSCSDNNEILDFFLPPGEFHFDDEDEIDKESIDEILSMINTKEIQIILSLPPFSQN